MSYREEYQLSPTFRADAHRNGGGSTLGTFTIISEEVDSSGSSASYGLSHFEHHGTPFVILVDRNGAVIDADRRDGWRSLVESIGPFNGDRLPERLARMVGRHCFTPPPEHAASVSVVGAALLVSVVAFRDRSDMAIVLLWSFDREQVLAAAGGRYALTKRECELLDRILQGESTAEIAQNLSIAVATVEWHTKRMLLKTDSNNRTQMTSRVLGWLPDID